MKKSIFFIFAILAGQSMLAMEPAEQSNLSQQDRDDLAWELSSAVLNQEYEKAIDLIDRGANVNKNTGAGRPINHIFHYLEVTPEQNEQRIRLVQKFIEKGVYLDPNFLVDCKVDIENNKQIMQLLLDAGIDIYDTTMGDTPLVWHAMSIFPCLECVQMIAQKAVSLTPDELNSVKNWLLVDQRLRQEGRSIHKDLRRSIVQAIIDSLSHDVFERYKRAGGIIALQKTPNDQKHFEVYSFLLTLSSPEFIRTYVRHKVLEAIRTNPYTRELSEDEAFGTFNNPSSSLGTGSNQ